MPRTLNDPDRDLLVGKKVKLLGCTRTSVTVDRAAPVVQCTNDAVRFTNVVDVGAESNATVNTDSGLVLVGRYCTILS